MASSEDERDFSEIQCASVVGRPDLEVAQYGLQRTSTAYFRLNCCFELFDQSQSVTR